jgi:hypothetical protein
MVRSTNTQSGTHNFRRKCNALIRWISNQKHFTQEKIDKSRERLTRLIVAVSPNLKRELNLLATWLPEWHLVPRAHQMAPRNDTRFGAISVIDTGKLDRAASASSAPEKNLERIILIMSSVSPAEIQQAEPFFAIGELESDEPE